MNDMFDSQHIRRAFSRAARGYDAAAALQREIEARLLESLDYLDQRVPGVVLDLGCGPAHAAAAMRRRWPRARVLAIDLALPMLQQARSRAGLGALAWSGWRPPLARINADVRALPLADGSVDVLFCNLCLQWVDDLAGAFAGFRRVLKPDGLLLCSSFGPATLQELRAAFAEADSVPHVSPFASIAQFGDALMHAGFRDPVLDRDVFVRDYADLPALMRELRALGATNALASRRHTLTGKARFATAAQAYARRDGDGRLPATWEVVYAQAWGPQPGAPIREGGFDVASVPASRIPVRRR